MPYLNYEAWIDRLSNFFFSPGNEGQPTTLFVDDELLDDLYGEPGGVQSLVSAVKARLRPEGDGMFSAIYQDCLGWKVHGAIGWPPSLPLLTTCVLAASRMASGETSGGRHISSANYYHRFRQLLALGGSGTVAGYDGDIPALWKQLKWWMNDSELSRFGTSTLPDSPALANIGYALSQSLFRQSDRQRLTEFLRAISFQSADRLSPAELLVMFRAWAPRSTLSAGAKLMAQDDEYAAQMSGILSAAATHWDGTVRDEAGRKLAQVLIRLVPRPLSVDLLAECPDSFPSEGDFAYGTASSVHLVRTAPGWYGPIRIPIESAFLETGLRLRSARFALALQGEPIHILSQARPVNGWSTTRTIDSMEEHILLVQRNRSTEVEQYLAEFANAGWSPTNRPIAGMPAGWTVYTGVRIERPPARNVKGALSILVPSLRSRARLWGGLPITQLRNAYLSGGEPAVLVPTEGEQIRSVELVIDSATEPTSTAAGMIFLTGRGLADGEHTVSLGPTDMRFTLVDGCGVLEPAGTGTIGHLIAADPAPKAITYAAGRLTEETHAVCRVAGGAVQDAGAVAGRLPRPVVLLGEAEEYMLLGARPGEIVKPRQPRAPEWLKSVGLNATCFEVYAPFQAVWVLALRSAGWTVRLAADLPVNMDEPFAATNNLVVDWMQPFQWGPDRIQPPGTGYERWASYRQAVDEYVTG